MSEISRAIKSISSEAWESAFEARFGGSSTAETRSPEALKIYERALKRIANLNCRTLEQYVAKADAIAIEALVLVENLD